MNFLPESFGQVNINLNHKASVNYAKSRYAIEAECDVIARSNAARAKRLRNMYKEALLEIFQGEVERSPKGLKVVFHDGSEAKY